VIALLCAVLSGAMFYFSQGPDVVRSAFNGLETVSDAQGRILARASTVQTGMVRLSAEVPLGPGPTLYTQIGDIFAWVCVLASALLGFLALRAKGAGRERPREV
jgi:apolipoprotein N-acyltransferase